MQKENELTEITNNIKEYYEDEIKILINKKLKSKIASKPIKKNEQEEESSMFSMFTTCKFRKKEDKKEEEEIPAKNVTKEIKKEDESSCLIF